MLVGLMSFVPAHCLAGPSCSSPPSRPPPNKPGLQPSSSAGLQSSPPSRPRLQPSSSSGLQSPPPSRPPPSRPGLQPSSSSGLQPTADQARAKAEALEAAMNAQESASCARMVANAADFASAEAQEYASLARSCSLAVCVDIIFLHKQPPGIWCID